ncbi:hypothetical protein PsalMR5_04195 (plasmid) [Piscirickettsia salmonis]|nr:hypothetical protein PsalSR1_04191 [Piscirickettsia salmonis]QGP61683.1 hypothetical protein PsalBI1_04325 [Piscirickettsia salmonis]QGP66270.1 hypothetical protein PsalMR5_04195 [Piscirickettsia salmonis]
MTSLSEKIIKPKLGVLELAKQLGNVSKACEVMGYSRDSFYRFKKLYETGGEEALQEISKKKPNVKNRVPEHIEQAVIDLANKFAQNSIYLSSQQATRYFGKLPLRVVMRFVFFRSKLRGIRPLAIENPALGQLRASNELLQRGIIVSSSGVRSVWLRNDLETFKKRLKALEAKSAQDGILLTEEQLQALEKAKQEKEAHGEIETEHPGYLGSQDTYYVGTMKGVGRIYQQTFVDTYSRVAFACLYTEKNAVTAAHALNESVIPWFEERDTPLLRKWSVKYIF